MLAYFPEHRPLTLAPDFDRYHQMHSPLLEGQNHIATGIFVGQARSPDCISEQVDNVACSLNVN